MGISGPNLKIRNIPGNLERLATMILKGGKSRTQYLVPIQNVSVVGGPASGWKSRSTEMSKPDFTFLFCFGKNNLIHPITLFCVLAFVE